MKRKWLIPALLAILILGVAGYYAYNEFSRGVPSVLEATPVFQGSVDVFLGGFERQADSADKQLQNGVVELTGHWEHMELRDTAAYVEFRAGKTLLQATFNADGTKDLKKNMAWQRDSVITFRGYYYGYTPGESLLGETMPGAVQLGRCRLVRPSQSP